MIYSLIVLFLSWPVQVIYQYETVRDLGMHQILFSTDIRPAGYPANPKAGYRISVKGRIPDIRSDTWPDNFILW
jgi:hypothetical protein